MKDFEKEIISKLLSQSELKEITLPSNESDLNVEFTGAGYYLSFKNTELPEERHVLNKPVISGTLGNTEVGFVAFIEKMQFTLECYTFNEAFPEKNRNEPFTPEAT